MKGPMNAIHVLLVNFLVVKIVPELNIVFKFGKVTQKCDILSIRKNPYKLLFTNFKNWICTIDCTVDDLNTFCYHPITSKITRTYYVILPVPSINQKRSCQESSPSTIVPVSVMIRTVLRAVCNGKFLGHPFTGWPL